MEDCKKGARRPLLKTNPTNESAIWEESAYEVSPEQFSGQA